MLPNFLGIGAARCATTWIYHCLAEHPRIFVPQGRKELYFFTRHYSKGLGWYRSWFRECRKEKAVGEISPFYLFVPGTAERIHKHIPHVRLIVSLRNPIDRAYSEYGLDIRRGRHSLTFEESLEVYPEYIERGFYYVQITRYLPLFPRENLLIQLYDDLQRDPLDFIGHIYAFLDVDSEFVPSHVGQVRNRGMTNLVDWRVRVFRNISNRLNSIASVQPILETLKRQGIVAKTMGSLVFRNAREKMNPYTRRRLQAIYYPHNERLSSLLGLDFNIMWK